MALAPWNVLAGGKIRSDAEEQRRRETGEKGQKGVSENYSQLKLKYSTFLLGRALSSSNWERSDDERKVSQALEKVATEVGAKSINAGLSLYAVSFTCTTVLTQRVVAIAYVLQKTPYVFPIIGGRKIEHLHANIEALNIALSPEQISYLESVLPFNPGFPFSQFVSIVLALFMEPAILRRLFAGRRLELQQVVLVRGEL